MSDVDSTIAYYDQFGLDFAASTVAVDMEPLYGRFLGLLPTGSAILDAGCGSGRDTKAFLEKGYQVTAIDGSRTMVQATTALTGLPARQLKFQDLDYLQAFDGIWACATLLHVPRGELDAVFQRLTNAARHRGLIYVSFKYGQGDRISKGRHFTDFTPQSLRDWLSGHDQLQLQDLWETGDQRAERASERWVNALLQRVQS